MTAPDVLTVGSVMEQESETSWSQRYAAVAHTTGRVVAEGSAELVWFDYVEGARRVISADTARRLFGRHA